MVIVINADVITDILTRNEIVASGFWLEMWLMCSVAVGAMTPMSKPPWYMVLGGPITMLVLADSDVKVIAICIIVTMASYSLSLCFLAQDNSFTVCIMIATFSAIVAWCSSIKSMDNMKRNIRVGKEKSHHTVSYVLAPMDGFMGSVLSEREEIKRQRLKHRNEPPKVVNSLE